MSVAWYLLACLGLGLLSVLVFLGLIWWGAWVSALFVHWHRDHLRKMEKGCHNP